MTKIPQMEPWFDEAESKAVGEYMKSGGWMTEHKKTADLEAALGKFIGAKHVVMVPNGTLALVAALWAVGVRAGDEVVVPNLTMIATPNAGLLLGAKPVLVDIEADSLNLDPELVKQAITPKTRAVIFVPLNGRPGRLLEIKEICQQRNIPLVEDAAQALGSYFGNQHLGTFGTLGTFSFSTPKIISTGQGGAVATNDDTLGEALRRLKDFGRAQGGIDIHNTIGFNFKFTDIQAVIGLTQMQKLPTRIQRKRAIYKRYADNFATIKSVAMPVTNLAETTPWFIDIFVDEPDKLAAHLAKQDIGTRRIYPAINTQPALRQAQGKTAYPVSEKVASQGLWLPSANQLTDEDIDRVCQAVEEFL